LPLAPKSCIEFVVKGNADDINEEEEVIGGIGKREEELKLTFVSSVFTTVFVVAAAADI
jgi:hypothetical protein